MYSHHFGLSQDPFSIAPDPRYLFMSERHREALAHLLYGVAGQGSDSGGTGGGFVLLTGDIGTGKTTICRCFLEQIPAGCHVAYIFNPKLTVTELLRSICDEFHIDVASGEGRLPTVKDFIDALNAFLLQSHANGQRSLLIIDEAQNLDPDVLEQLRLLTNLETSERKLLQIVLIGQPELREKLARPELEQLAQRVIARFHLDALSPAETTQYIGHRLAVGGHTGGALPFDSAAIKRIHHLTRGVPRLINLLCARALLGAWANGLQRVDPKVVSKAATEVFGPEQLMRAPSRLPSKAVYALGGFALLASVAMITYLGWASPSSIRPTGQAQTSSLLSGRTDAIDTQALEDVDTLLDQLTTTIDVAWRNMAPIWELANDGADPCPTGSEQPLRCYHTASLTVPGLRQLDRPGILALESGTGQTRYAVLVGLNERSAGLLIEGRVHQVRLVSLAKRWRGDFSTYWRPPLGYSGDLRDGSSGPAIDHLARQLALFDGTSESATSTEPQVLSATLRERVRAFQRAQGLAPDGQPGPMTFMQLDSATGANEPNLQSVQTQSHVLHP